LKKRFSTEPDAMDFAAAEYGKDDAVAPHRNKSYSRMHFLVRVKRLGLPEEPITKVDEERNSG
jgi:hypothetical protein